MNETRRLIIFFIITFAILFLTNQLYRPKSKEAEKPVDTTVKKAVVQQETIKPMVDSIKEETVVIDRENFRAVFSNIGAGLKSLYLKEFDAELVPPDGYLFTNLFGDRNLSRAGFAFKADGETLTFIKELENMRLEKKFIFNDPYGFELVIRGEPENFLLINSLESGMAITETKNKNEDLKHFAIYLKGKEKIFKDRKNFYTHRWNPEWLGLRNKYFFLALVNNGQLDSATTMALEDKRFGLRIYSFGSERFQVYCLPLQYNLLKKFNRNFEEIIKGGIFGPISRFFLSVLKLFYVFLKNYGWAIVLFALIVKTIFFPLSMNMLKAQKRMQLIQPEIQKIQAKYRDNPGEMNREIMAMYKAYKVNPLSGCLPLLIQMPIFFALYSMLTTSIELRRAPFLLWIDDLSLKDPYYILPIAMGVISIVQSLFTLTDPRQKMMVILMPVFMTYIFLFMPSGLQLYWFVYTVFSLIEQFVIKRYGGIK
ncbi:MAG: membrane protein insertase YidC [candidate division WOR-3 bacterium]